MLAFRQWLRNEPDIEHLTVLDIHKRARAQGFAEDAIVPRSIYKERTARNKRIRQQLLVDSERFIRNEELRLLSETLGLDVAVVQRTYWDVRQTTEKSYPALYRFENSPTPPPPPKKPPSTKKSAPPPPPPPKEAKPHAKAGQPPLDEMSLSQLQKLSKRLRKVIKRKKVEKFNQEVAKAGTPTR